MNDTTATATAPVTAELPQATYPCAIRARDFSHDTTDPNRDLWSAGTLRHVIAALAGTPVAVTTDNQTGHTVCGARLVGLTCSGDRVIVEHRYGPGPTDVQRTNYLLFALGDTIVPLASGAGTPAKFAATGSHRDEVSAAIRAAQAAHGDVEGRSWGRWTGRCEREGVYVRYTPSTGNPAFAGQAGTRWSGLVVGDRVVSSSPGRAPRV